MHLNGMEKDGYLECSWGYEMTTLNQFRLLLNGTTKREFNSMDYTVYFLAQQQFIIIISKRT